MEKHNQATGPVTGPDSPDGRQTGGAGRSGWWSDTRPSTGRAYRRAASAAEYQFGTRWVVEAPLVSVWGTVCDPQLWPRWWPDVRTAQVLQRGRPDGTGHRVRYVFRSALPYTLRFDSVVREVRPPNRVVVEVSGDLEGVGRWELAEEDGVTVLECTWRVRTTKPAMKALAPLLRPVFVWNHHRMMRRGAEGMARLTGARLSGVDASPRLGLAEWRVPLSLLAVALLTIAAGRRLFARSSAFAPQGG